MLKWWKKRKEKKKYMKGKKVDKLPKDFAKKVIELEIKCEKIDCDKEDITDLMNLYTHAIEYYNYKADRQNQEHYQMRLHQFIKKD